MVTVEESLPSPLAGADVVVSSDGLGTSVISKALPPPQFGQFTHEGVQHRPNQEGPAVLVRNTFLDIDDRPPTPQELVRASTTPPGYPSAEDEARRRRERRRSDSRSSSSSRSSSGSDDEGEGEDGVGCLSSPPPRPDGLCRYRTGDEFESAEAWSWASTPAVAAAAIPSAADAAMRAAGPTGVDAAAATAIAAAVPNFGGGAAQPAVPVYALQPVVAAAAACTGGADAGALLAPGAVGSGVMAGNGAVYFPSQPGRVVGWHEGQQQQQPQPQPSQLLQLVQQQQAQQHAQGQVSRQADSILIEAGSEGPEAGVFDGAEDGTSPAAPPQPQTLTRTLSASTGYFRVHWTVDARKLRGNDKQAVSPPFELSFGESFPNITFKMMIYPKIVSDAKGGAAFKKSHGRGYVQLKCEAELSEAIANVSFRISIGSGERRQPFRGPVSHNFSASAVCGLPKEQDEWDFRSVVDEASATFVVCLEIVPNTPGIQR